MKKRIRWESNRHIKETLYRYKNKRQIWKEDCVEQLSRHKKNKEGDKKDSENGKQVKVEH
jgi:uncharacterized protein YaeQ